MEKVSKEIAEQEVIKWLDFKRVKENTRESYKSAIEEITNAIEFGDLVLNDETMEFEQSLTFPVGQELTIDKLVFKPRLKIGEIQKAMRGVKSDDTQGMIMAIVSALTTKTTGVLKELDTQDYGICQNIALFFVPK